jgi:hypothetical protein
VLFDEGHKGFIILIKIHIRALFHTPIIYHKRTYYQG